MASQLTWILYRINKVDDIDIGKSVMLRENYFFVSRAIYSASEEEDIRLFFANNSKTIT